MKISIINNEEKISKKNFVKVVLSSKVSSEKFTVVNNNANLEISCEKRINRRKWILVVRKIIQEAKRHKIKNILIDWTELTGFKNIGNELEKLFAENVIMSNYEFRKYKKTPKDGWSDVENIFVFSQKKISRKKFKVGEIIGKWTNFCRDLANTPGGDMTPDILVKKIRKVVFKTSIKMRVLNEVQMKKYGMRGILAVGSGSRHSSRFIILEYQKGNKSEKPIVLIGKGVTFDSGGIDTKPHPYALDMMMDMSGGAAAVSALLAIENMKVNKNIVVIVPAVENMPGGSSFRPGDIVKMMNGITVEVGHTDAEGRLILADALTFAKKYNPKKVIDIATLTGAALTALGSHANAIFTNDDGLAKQTEDIAEKVGDYVWRLPLWEEYEKDIEGNYADISNINTKTKPGYGGAITAASFLKYFAKDYKSWMHIDIAPRMTAGYNENLSKGATGTPVRLLVDLLK